MLTQSALPVALLTLLSSAGSSSDASRLPSRAPAVTVSVIVSGAEEDGGLISAALFAPPDGFPMDQAKPAHRLARPRSSPVDSVIFTGVTPGSYAVVVFHDTNGNGQLDTGRFGAPKEPWGTTGTVRPRFRAPRFNEAVIDVMSDTRVEIRVRR